MSSPRFVAAFLAALWMLGHRAPAEGYELTTHREIAQRAFDASQGVLHYLDDLRINASDTFDPVSATPFQQLDFFRNEGTLRDWTVEGAIREDDFKPSPANLKCPQPKNPPSPINRVFNHFLDVQRGNRGLTTLGVTKGLPAPDWALINQPNLEDGKPNEFSIPRAREYQFQALTAESRTDRDRETARLFRSLGQVTHLLQDMAQPQHTRNDRHGGCAQIVAGLISGEKSWYEDYIDARAKGSVFRGRFGTRPLSIGAYPPPLLSGYRDFWQNQDGTGLGDFSSRNFLSAGTNLPECSSLLQPPCSIGAYQRREVPLAARTLSGVEVNSPVVLLLRTLQDPITRKVIPDVALASLSLWDQHLEGLDPFRANFFSMNTINYDAISDVLLPRAVGYSAGLLDYFFRGRLAMYVAPNEPGRMRIRNLSKERMEGQFRIYADGADGNRALVQDLQSFVLEPKGAPGDTTGPLMMPVSAGQYLTLVFRGSLGQEVDAVAARVPRPRLAFAGQTCKPGDAACQDRLTGLYRWDAGPAGEPARITSLSKRELGEGFIDSRPAWATDGGQLAFTSNKGSAQQDQFTLWLMDEGAANRRQATLNNDGVTPIRIDGRPAWSPDGNRITFPRVTDPVAAAAGLGGRNLFIYDMRTGTVAQVTGLGRPAPGSPPSFLNTFDIADPAWAPDGVRILVAAHVGGMQSAKPTPCSSNPRSYELLLVTPAGGLDRWLTCTQGIGVTGQVLNQEPTWTLDGQTVLFRRATNTTPQSDLYSVRPGGPVDPTTGVPLRTQLTATGAPTEMAPTVAPNLLTVAFASDRTAAFHIYTLDRTAPLPVTDYAPSCLTCGNTLGIVGASDPAWSPGLP